jgi:hypothetical protein
MNADSVRIPFYVEKDGSNTFFLPKCRTKSGFKIAPKGSEDQFTDYWVALTLLTSMQTPRFRRPNAEGNFGGLKCEAGALEDVQRDFIFDELARHG